MSHTVRLILGDQLNPKHPWFQEKRHDVSYVLMEMRQETDYTRHHIQKIVGFFLSMRQFAKTLTEREHEVIYYRLDDPENKHTLEENLTQVFNQKSASRFEYIEPDEYRLDRQLKDFCASIMLDTEVYEAEHFLTSRSFLKDFFGDKEPLMERFYRQMRKEYHLLMDEDKPLGGKWNYDKQNRKRPPRNHDFPPHWEKKRDVSDLVQMIEDAGVEYIGEIDKKSFNWPIGRQEALDLLDHFLNYGLEHFGRYQDAMDPDEWLLYHSRVSFSLNTKQIDPLTVVKRVISYGLKNSDRVDLAQVEGYVRQIVGWREYMRGIYWWKMPDYAEMNALEHDQPLPEFYWTGQTQMNCLRHAIGQSLRYAYAHHIQRLMITGNFALLCGVDPDAVDQWYLGIYMDAIQWVEITNTRGMSQYADGGIVGTKPYVSSANYINKMSHYCKGCRYDPKKRTGEGACPYNSLYWNFIDRHRDKLADNPRMSMMYRLWDKRKDREELLQQAEDYLSRINEL